MPRDDDVLVRQAPFVTGLSVDQEPILAPEVIDPVLVPIILHELEVLPRRIDVVEHEVGTAAPTDHPSMRRMVEKQNDLRPVHDDQSRARP